jgi:hypothetical protein
MLRIALTICLLAFMAWAACASAITKHEELSDPSNRVMPVYDVLVDEYGVVKVELVQSSGNEETDELAKKQLLSRTYEQSYIDGKPVAIKYTVIATTH